jgi:extradiol dioxygenase family protein
MKKSNQSANFSSFHGTVIKTSVNHLKQVVGEPEWSDNTGEDKTNFKWVCETHFGDVVTIYDWKEYRSISEDEIIEFHLGGFSKSSTEDGKIELLIALANI